DVPTACDTAVRPADSGADPRVLPVGDRRRPARPDLAGAGRPGRRGTAAEDRDAAPAGPGPPACAAGTDGGPGRGEDTRARPGPASTTSSTTWTRAPCTASPTGTPPSSTATSVCTSALRIRDAPADPAASSRSPASSTTTSGHIIDDIRSPGTSSPVISSPSP